jgi:import inner membrane translocase subunit TIM44
MQRLVLRSVGRPAIGASRMAFHVSRSLKENTKNSNSSHGDKTPFQVFMDTFKDEWGKSKELQHNIKALQDETGRMSESGAYKKAKEALEKAKSGTSAASSVTGETLKKAGRVVGQAASTAWESPVVKTTRTAVHKTAESVDKATEPIRKTELYKNVKEVIDDGSSMRYGGFEEKEARRKRRELDEKRRGTANFVPTNPEAGQNVVVHDTAKPEKKLFEDFDKTTLGKRMADLRLAYEESENGFVSGVRSVTDKIGSFFEETEGAKVVRMFKNMDPTFSQEEFLREVRQYILPEVLDAYVKGDADTLKQWLSEAPFNIWATSAKQYKDQGLYSAGRVLDIRGVDVLSSKLLSPSDVPVFVIGCRAQEVHLYKKLKTDEIAAGMEDHIQLTTYAMVITRIAEEMDNKETKGWKLLELVRGQSREWT